MRRMGLRADPEVVLAAVQQYPIGTGARCSMGRCVGVAQRTARFMMDAAAASMGGALRLCTSDELRPEYVTVVLDAVLQCPFERWNTPLAEVRGIVRTARVVLVTEGVTLTAACWRLLHATHDSTR